MNEKMLQDLINSIPALAATGNHEAVNRVLDIINGLKNAKEVNSQQVASGKYLYARVLTLVDGTKHYHPLVGGMYPSNEAEDYKMEAYDSILELQDAPIATVADMAKRAGYNIQILHVPNDVFAKLEEQLAGLVSIVFAEVDAAVEHLEIASMFMGNSMASGALKAQALQTIMSRPSVSGVGLTASNEIVERTDYVDLEVDNHCDDYCDCCDCEDCCDCDDCCGSEYDSCYDCPYYDEDDEICRCKDN